MGRQGTLARQIAEERQAIQIRLKRLVPHLDNGVPRQGSSSDDAGDILDVVQQGVLEEQEATAHELLVSRAKALARAWESLQRGTYGTCQMCGKRIPSRRLVAVPFAVFCLPCQEKVEKSAKVFPPAKVGWWQAKKGEGSWNG